MKEIKQRRQLYKNLYSVLNLQGHIFQTAVLLYWFIILEVQNV